ncbi:hypothetical protein C4J81_15790 [Deltaproteobacteria bacterium Smac51]|nr:hypothetical protein C4J81_15790 [Deltaproteobacteria bacterium Smac51]
MTDTVIHDLRSEEHIEAIHFLKEYLGAGETNPVGLRLTGNLAIIGVSSVLERNGWKVQKYQAGNDHLVLGSPPGAPTLTVWYGHGGWKVRRSDDESSANAPDQMARLVSEIRPGQDGDDCPGDADRNRTVDDYSKMTAIIINSDSMGYGNSEVGLKLLLTYFDTLTAMATPPEIIFFYNSAAKLTTLPSAVLPAIKDLAMQGTNILTCSICLDHFNLGDQLKVGRKSNMYELINIITTYGNVIYL